MGFPITDYDFIRQAHRKLLGQFEYKTDREQHQVLEYWAGDEMLAAAVKGLKFVGDCEEFARACMLKMRERGIKARLVYCLVETGEGHCICEVASADNKEAYLLDNRHDTLKTSTQLSNYKYLRVSQWNPMPGSKALWMHVA